MMMIPVRKAFFAICMILHALCNVAIAAEQQHNPTSIQKITTEQIDAHKQIIKKQLLHNKYMRYGLRGLSLCVCAGLAGYCVWNYYFSDVPQEQRSVAAGTLIEQFIAEGGHTVVNVQQLKYVLTPLFENMEALNNSMERLKMSITQPSSSWWSWCKLIGGKIRDGIIVSAGLLTMHRMHTYISQLFSEKDLDWFIQTCTKVDKSLTQLRHAVQQLNTPSDKQYQREFYLLMVPRSCNDLVHDVSRIIAFMEYTIDQLPPETIAAHALDAISMYLICCVNDHCQKIEEALHSLTAGDASAGTIIETEVAHLETELMHTINQFKSSIAQITVPAEETA